MREIESLLPVKKCHTVDDFLKLTSLYDETGWNCEGSEWTILAKKYFSCIQAHHDEHSMLPIGTQCASPLTPLFFSTANKEFIDGKTGIILGCTHYSYLKKSLQKLFPQEIIIDPSEESAEKIFGYLERHDTILQGLVK